ncbi:hypothetical protein ElyMa_001437000 [Elysia marginata]|uniref:Thyroglobulin type-1 domain-containing protein n=1 Tax=Elysia marginata TaxID=1093978 RepID=A0AAV4J2L3_9GAST|nr:hypothetical protein ElyMa_001437000 [Elysia marginata]
MGLVKGSPSVELLEVLSSNHCDANFHLPGLDYTVLKYNVTGANSMFQLNALTSPRLNNIQTGNALCSLIDPGTNECRYNLVEGHPCWCDKINDNEYHLTYNRTADAETSNVTVALAWIAYINVLLTDRYTFKQVITAKMILIQFRSTFKTSQEFLVAGEDFTEIEFDVYGGEIYNIPESGNAPQFYYVTSDGVEHKKGLLFPPTNPRAETNKEEKDSYKMAI